MTPRFPLPILAGIVFFIFLSQVIAVYWHLYFQYWWLDIPMHIIGGFWIGLFGLTVYYASSSTPEKEHSTLFVFALAIALTLVVGLVWEIYEFGVDHAVGDTGNSLADTLKDLSDDLIGAVLAGALFIRGGYNKKSFTQ